MGGGSLLKGTVPCVSSPVPHRLSHHQDQGSSRVVVPVPSSRRNVLKLFMAAAASGGGASLQVLHPIMLRSDLTAPLTDV